MAEVSSNLDKYYKTDKKHELEGIWFEPADGVRFRVKRAGGMNSQAFKSVIAKYHKPYAKQIEAGSLPPEKDLEISVKAFVESCLVGWEGVEIDGKPAEYSFDNAVKLLISLPDLASALMEHAQNSEHYKAELGNS